MKTKTSRQIYRVRPLLLAALLFVTIIGGTILHPQAKAEAAGETYAFSGTGATAVINVAGTQPMQLLAKDATDASYGFVETCGGTSGTIMTYTVTGVGAQAGNSSPATISTTITSATGLGPGVICTGWPNLNGAITVTGTNPTPAGNGAAGATAAAGPSCEGTLGPLGWILCSVFTTVGDIVQWILTNIIQPFLITAPISTDPASSSYQVWSSFRVYGDIFLVFALLVVVFGQSIGGGLVDAYTAKKVLPRLLVAAILINLSIYIVALMVDLTNILWQGVGNLITEPLRQAGAWTFKISGGQIAGVFTVGIIGLVLSAGVVSGLVVALSTASGAGAAISMLIFALLPMILAVVAVFLTLIIRKGIILLLVLVSPVAFALYCLPNTEKYFRKWWDALLTTLLVYPIIMLVFAIADVLSVTILTANNVGQAQVVAYAKAGATTGPSPLSNNEVLALIVAFVAQFLPLFLIPFAFRLAGGFLGRMHEVATGVGNRVNNHGVVKRKRDQVSADYKSRSVQGRERAFNSLQAAGSRGGFAKRNAAKFLANRVGGHNINAEASAEQAMRNKIVEDQIATGIDGTVRGATVNKRHALSQRESVYNAATNSWSEGQWRRKSDGTREFKSLGGAWVREADVDAGNRLFGDKFSRQAALSYEIRKANEEGQTENLATNYRAVAQGPGGWGMSDFEAGGAWTGATFANQGMHLALKHTNWKNGTMIDDNGNDKGLEYLTETYEKKNSGAISQMGSYDILKLQETHARAVANQNIEAQQKGAAVAEVFMHDMGAGYGAQYGGDDEHPVRMPEQPVPGSAAGYQPQRVTSAYASPHATERIREYVRMTGVKTAEPSGVYEQPAHYESGNGSKASLPTPQINPGDDWRGGRDHK
jgi:hypothetical protein